MLAGTAKIEERIREDALARAKELEEKLAATEAELEKAKLALEEHDKDIAANAAHENRLVARLKAASDTLAGK